MTPFVIYADFKSILEPSGRQVKNITYTQQQKVCAAAAILISRFNNFDKRTVMKVGETALTELVWHAHHLGSEDRGDSPDESGD